MEINQCPNCGETFELTSSTESNVRGRVIFRSWLCPGCGVRRETRRIGSEPEEILMTSPPRAVIDAAAQERADAVAEGVRQFFAKGDRHVARA